MQSEGDQRFFQSPQEVFEETAQNVDIIDLTEHEWSLPLDESISELLHQTFSSRYSVKSSLQTAETFLMNQMEQHRLAHSLKEREDDLTSSSPLLSISATHSTISLGILGWVSGAKLSNEF